MDGPIYILGEEVNRPHSNSITNIGVYLQDPNAILPKRATEGSAGFDIYTPKDFDISPGEILTVDTGLVFHIPPDWSGLLFARSGLATKRGISLATGVSLIDSDFRETLKVPLSMPRCPDREAHESLYFVSHSCRFAVKAGDRIAQIAFWKLAEVGLEVAEVREFSVGDRAGGFGSTGA